MSRPGRGPRAIAIAALAVVALAFVATGPRYLRAAALMVDASGIDGWPHRVAGWRAHGVRRQELQIPSRDGALNARLYRPEGRTRTALVLAPGVHAGGLDEPRLVEFAGHLASRGVTVLTVELPDLLRYRITPRTTDMIEDAAAWLAGASGVAPEGSVGLVGISFAGGLAVSAAGRPALRDRVRFVVSVGGQGDLRRTLRYLCTGIDADGTPRPPHDYGVAIALLAVADRLVSAAQAEPLRNGILIFLEASRLDATDRRSAAAAFARAREVERGLGEPAATLMRRVNERDVAALGAVLLPLVASMPDEPALSPELAPAPRAPVYLLHGAGDDVIPATESRLLAARIAGQTRVELLITPVMRHAEVERRPGLRDAWRLVDFWAGVLDE